MKYLIFISLFFISFLFANIDKDITKETNNLSKVVEKHQDLYDKIKKFASEISTTNSTIISIEKDMKKFDRILNINKNKYNREMKKSKKLKDEFKILIDKKRKLEQDLISFLAKDISLSIILNETGGGDLNGLISEEAFYVFQKITKESIENMKDEFTKIQKNIDKHKRIIDKVQIYIDSIDKKKNALFELKTQKTKVRKKLEKKKVKYNKQLKKIFDKKIALENILKKLEIIKVKEDKKSEEKLKDLKQKEKDLKEVIKNDSDYDVRQIGSSYQRVKTLRYRGKKTISPLEKATVIKKFGTYFDPVYKMKIFNQSITLKSKKLNAKVKAVLRGKIIFAKETALLGKVVILEHKKNMHTIYAHLSQIPSRIKIGNTVTKGYTIGRIESELVFEVTQKRFHINPLKLINLK